MDIKTKYDIGQRVYYVNEASRYGEIGVGVVETILVSRDYTEYIFADGSRSGIVSNLVDDLYLMIRKRVNDDFIENVKRLDFNKEEAEKRMRE